MSTDFAIRSVAVAQPTPIITPTAREAVPTVLPAQQTVAAATPIDRPRNNLPTTPDQVGRQITFDRDAAAVVYQTVDERTNEVVAQFPNDALLRRRAYFRSLDQQKADAPPLPRQQLPTDRKA